MTAPALTARARRGPATRRAPWTLIGPVVEVVAEASWTWVAYLLLGIMGGGDRPLGLLVFVLVTGGAMLVGSQLDADAIGALPVAVGCVAVALAGLVVAPGALTHLAAGDPMGALALHPGGPLLGVAALRGVLRGRALDTPDPDATGFGWIAAVLAGCWFFGAALVQPGRGTFTAGATGPTILFILAAPAAAALLQVGAIARSQGWTRSVDRSWLALLLATLLMAGGLAWIGASAAGQLGALGPVLVLSVVALGLSRIPPPANRPRRAGALRGWLLLLVALFVLLAIVRPLAAPPQNTPPVSAVTAGQDEGERQGGTILLGVGLAIGAIVVILALRQRRDRRPAELVAPDAPSRSIPDRIRVAGPRSWRPWRRRRPGEPGDAAGAYRAALTELAREPATERLPGETPTEHARRLRGAGTGGLALELLAADYELVRFAGRDLADREHARAIGRWRAVKEAADARRWAETMARRAAAERPGADVPEGPDQDEEAMRERAGRV